MNTLVIKYEERDEFGNEMEHRDTKFKNITNYHDNLDNGYISFTIERKRYQISTLRVRSVLFKQN